MSNAGARLRAQAGWRVFREGSELQFARRTQAYIDEMVASKGQHRSSGLSHPSGGNSDAATLAALLEQLDAHARSDAVVLVQPKGGILEGNDTRAAKHQGQVLADR